MEDSKDCWDKIEIIGKVTVPIAVGVLILVWNNQRTSQQTAASMTQIAVSVLSQEVEDSKIDPLRDWAVAVLQNPSNPPTLSDEAAAQLRTSALPWNTSVQSSFDQLGSADGWRYLLLEPTPIPLGDDLR